MSTAETSKDPAPEPTTAGAPQAAADTSAEAQDGPEGAAESQPKPVSNPAKVLRMGHVSAKMLDELKGVELDPAGRKRLAAIHMTAVQELRGVIDAHLAAELDALTPELSSRSTPSQAELLVAQSCLVGWLDGLAQSLPHLFMSKQTVTIDPATAQALFAQANGPGEAAGASAQETGKPVASQGNYL